MSLQKEGLSLFEAARAVGVSFSQEVEPQSREVDAKGLTLHYLDWGNEDKQPLLYLHGALQQAHTWDFVALPLCADYHVMALDTRGHGDSQWAPDGDYSLDAHQRDLDAFVEAVGLDQFILVGHSMGGRNAYVYTSRHPEKVKALVIVDTGPQIRSQGEGRIRGFRELIDELDTYQEFADRIQQYTGRTRDQVMGALKYNIRQRSDGKWTWKYDKLLRTPGNRPAGWPVEKLWECVAGIKCPTLIVRGSESDIFSNETMEKMLEVIPDSTAVTVPRAGHLVAGDNPVDFLKAFQTLLDRI
jgi:pimeloyl-ACP methyl ester carboxylesterase